MMEEDVLPKVNMYNALISACTKGKVPGQALEVFLAVQRGGVVPDVLMYAASICTCVNGKQPVQALEVNDQLHSLGAQLKVRKLKSTS